MATGDRTRTCTRIPRLLLVTSDYHFYRDGRVHTTSSFMRFVPELLAFAGHIEVCAPVHPSSDAQGFSIEGPCITYRPLPPSRTIEGFLKRFPLDGIKIAGEVYRGMRRADLAWLNGPHPLQPLSAAIARLAHTPYLLYHRGDILEVARAKYGAGGARNRVALRTAWYLDKLIGVASRGAVVLYVGSNLRRHALRARYSQPAMASLVLDTQVAKGWRARLHSPLRLLWAGQLRPVKGLLYLLGAVRALLDSGIEVRLHIVGSGEQRQELEREVARLGLGSSVSLEGYVAPGPELDRYFEEADVFVFPSLSEGVPKVLLEAMARGLPVVASRVGGVPDVVCDGESGLLVRPGDAGALGEAIRRVIRDAGLRRRLSAGALAFAREHTGAAEAGRIGQGLRQAFPNIWSE